MRFPRQSEIIDFTAPERVGAPMEGDTAYQSSPIDDLVVEDVYVADGLVLKHFGSDVRLLLNQDRISKELAPVLNDVLKNARTSPELSDKFSNLSDSEILSCVKSRYLQAPSELKAWTDYLTNELKELHIKAEPSAETPSETPAETPAET